MKKIPYSRQFLQLGTGVKKCEETRTSFMGFICVTKFITHSWGKKFKHTN